MLKLSLGCGPRDFGSGWDHIDGGNYKHLKSKDIVSLPYADDSVDVIYSSHTLEYFDREEVKRVLFEWKRVLKQGGKLYLSVPDFGKMASLYLEGIPLHKFLGPLFGKMGMGSETIYHKTVYDYASLGELLKFMGFSRIEPWEPFEFQGEHIHGVDMVMGVNPVSLIDDHSQAQINGEFISLNLVCQK